VSEKYDRHTRDRSAERDRCPDCGRPFATLLEGTSSDGSPARFVWCPRCERVWVQAGGGQNPVVSRHARLLAREILRLKAQLATQLPTAPDAGPGTTSPAS
jgi:hypothetical protein